MAIKIYTSKIEKITARHFSRRNFSRQCAKLSLWAETEAGHEIWLLTQKGIGTRKISTKLEELEREYEFMQGKEIKYILKPNRMGLEDIGFLTPRGITPEDYRSNKSEYKNIGDGI
jgi:hypothetical protein